MISFNSNFITKCSLGVGGCLAIPAIVSGRKSENWFMSREISVSKEPLLECRLGQTHHYKVYLVFSNNWSGATAINDITLKIVDVNNSRGGAKENVVWGEGVPHNKIWRNWEIQIPRLGSVMLNVQKSEVGLFRSNQEVIPCSNNKINLKRSDNIGNTKIWQVQDGREIKKIKFEFSEQTCLKESKKDKCNITFHPSENLKWEKGFEPKAYFWIGY